jgi:hypothetical protein
MTFLLLNTFIGFLAGLICSLGGALKDSPYEGFQSLKFFRSMIVGTFCGGFATAFVPDCQWHLLLVFAFAGYAERFCVEGYKIVRAHRPGKFNLPHPSMLGRQFGFKKVSESHEVTP